jgi:uncharacterized protein (TIGR03437 family)
MTCPFRQKTRTAFCRRMFGMKTFLALVINMVSAGSVRRHGRGKKLAMYFGMALLAAGPQLLAQPAITAVENAASNLDPRLPNGGIAQGAIFVVYGKGLGPANIAIAPAAFQSTTLSNTSVAVIVGGTTVNAPLYYTSSGQVAALLPSNTPTGTGQITLTYNNQTSAKAPITVVANNMAIFSVDSTGTGPGIVTYADYSLVSPFKAANCGGPNTTCGAANPGDTLILWGTGLGAISGSDTSGSGLGVNMPNIPLTIWLGGVQAPVIYQGRSGCCIGEDQIVFTVPNNVPTGCSVPLAVQINNQVSNTTVMPVAIGSRTCTSATTPGVDISQLSTNSSITLGNVELDHFLNDNGNGFLDQAQGFFARISGLPATTQAFFASFLGNQPLGVCTVIGAKGPSDVFFNNLVNNGYVTLLDGGSNFTITGPKGAMTVQIPSGGQTVLSPSGAFLVPGDYSFAGTGGKDIGPFTAHITIPVTPTLTSPAGQNVTITRSKGMTVTWNPNGSTGRAEIVIASLVDQNTGAQVACTAPASEGTFTIPPYVLQALPASNGAIFYFQPGDQGPAFTSNFTATGLTIGIAQSFVDGVRLGAVLN